MLTGSLADAIGRRVGQLQVLQVVDGHAGADGGGQDVDALVDAVKAHGLGAQDAAVVGREQQLQVHGVRAGIVAGVAVGVDVDLAVGDAQAVEGGLGRRRCPRPSCQRP